MGNNPKPSYAAIEFPGTLRDISDPSRAIAALGGEQAVNAFLSCPAGDDVANSNLLPASRLTLNLRTRHTISSSNIVSEPIRPTPNLFLLELTDEYVTSLSPSPMSIAEQDSRSKVAKPPSLASKSTGKTSLASASSAATTTIETAIVTATTGKASEKPMATNNKVTSGEVTHTQTNTGPKTPGEPPRPAKPAGPRKKAVPATMATQSVPRQSATPTASKNTAAAQSKEKTKTTKVTRGRIVGRVTALTEFRALADFHYHPRDTFKATDGSIVNVVPPTTELNGLAEHLLDTLTNTPASKLPQDILLDRLRPSRFARSALERGTMNYWYKQYAFPMPQRPRESAPDESDETSLPLPLPPSSAPLHGIPLPFATADSPLAGPLALIPGRPLGDDGRSQPDRLDKLPHRVSYASSDVPSVAKIIRPPVHRGRQSYAQLLCLLKKLFRRRPVWVRRALLLGVPPELRTGFKKAISVVSYSFQGSGPFFQACIRYGYDPRKDPESRKYQVVEIRCGHPLVEAARVVQEEEEEDEEDDEEDDEDDNSIKRKVSSRTSRRQEEEVLVHGLENAKQDDEDADLDEEQMEIDGKVPLTTFQMPPEFLLNNIPKKRNNFFQICDISLPSIVKAVKQEKVARKYTSKDGFFTAGGIARMQMVAKNTLFNMSKEVVGEDRARQILRGNFQSIAAMCNRKRGRVQLCDVMKEGSQPPKKPGRRSTRRTSSAPSRGGYTGKAALSVPSLEGGDGEQDAEQRGLMEDDDDEEDAPLKPTGMLESHGVLGHRESSLNGLDADMDDMNGQLSYVVEGDTAEQDEDGDGEDEEDDKEDEEQSQADAEELAAFEVYDSDESAGDAFDDDCLDDDILGLGGGVDDDDDDEEDNGDEGEEQGEGEDR